MARADTTGAEFVAENEMAIKLLVPNYAAGAIIGRQGSTISAIQAESGTRIKLSQNRDFFPGTGDRVAFIVGTPDALQTAINALIDRIMTARDPQIDINPVLSVPRQPQVKIAIASAAAGLIIGKGGETIKSIQAETNARVQMSSKVSRSVHCCCCELRVMWILQESDVQVGERLLTVTGTVDEVKNAATRALNKLLENPAASTYSNPSASYGFEPETFYLPVSRVPWVQCAEFSHISRPVFQNTQYPPSARSSSRLPIIWLDTSSGGTERPSRRYRARPEPA